MRDVTVLLVGPHKLSRASLRSLLEGSPFAVVGEVPDVATIGALSGGAGLRDSDAVPDIALVELPDESTALSDVLERLDEAYPATRTVVLKDTFCMTALAACLGAGAGGFLVKDISRDALLRSLELVAVGETVFPTPLAGLLAHGMQRPRMRAVDVDNHGLSNREIEVLQYLLSGESNKGIANRLTITEATIKVHIKTLLRKIRVTNRTQAAIWAHGHGFVPASDAGPRTAGPFF